MRYLYFVKISDEAENGREAIGIVDSILEENNFVGEEGYWGSGKCDGYVIGGNWSGEFSGLDIPGDFSDEVCKLISTREHDRKERLFVSDAECKKYADDIQNLWIALGGKNANPYARDSFNSDGYDDDAVVLTADIIAALKKKYPNIDDAEYYDSGFNEERSISSLSEDDIGDWLVVVDYNW